MNRKGRCGTTSSQMCLMSSGQVQSNLLKKPSRQMLPSICRIQPHGHSRLKTQILYQQCQAESQSMKTIQELAPLTRIYPMRCPSIDTLRKCQVRVCNLTAELSINTYKDSILTERA